MGQYYIGLDLGQTHDYTAVCIATADEKKIDIGHLERIPLGTEYPEIVDYIHKLTMKDKFKGIRVIADQSGVGRPIIDMMQDRGIDVIPITITGGDSVTGNEWDGYGVPKRDLVTAFKVGLQAGEVLIRKRLRYSKKLVQEVQSFKYKLSQSGRDTYDTVRQSDHDDLILSCCLVTWFVRQAPVVQFFVGGGSGGPDQESIDRVFNGFKRV